MTNAELIQLYTTIDSARQQVAEQIRMRGIDWRHLAEYGMIPAAVIAYYKKSKETPTPCSLVEAKAVVEAFVAQR